MPEQTDTITQAEALLWLAGLERNCRDCQLPDSFGVKPELDKWCTPCHGTGKVPVLDLREPCPCIDNPGDGRPGDGYNCFRCFRYGRHEVTECTECNCKGRNWLPKQGRDALHEGMNKAGWWYDIYQHGSKRTIAFYLPGQGTHPRFGEDADDWLAAVKAMKEEERRYMGKNLTPE